MKKFLILFLCIFSVNAFAQEIAPEAASGYYPKSLTETFHNMVVSGHTLASRAGDDILEKGGNAVDAAIATQLVLNLVEPHASGIGGGGFMLYYDKENDKIYAYDGRETAPQSATPDMFMDKDGNIPPYQEALKGGLSVGTPGLLRMLEQVHEDHGKLAWEELFKPAIRLAKDGFPMSPRLYAIIASTPYIMKSPDAKELFFNRDGSVKPIGTIIKNRDFAKTLKKISKEGADAFYNGKIAKSIIKAVHNNEFKEGRLQESDLAEYSAIERDPVCTNYRDYKICGMPPPTSGSIAVLQALELLERFNLKEQKVNSADSVHLIMESVRLAFADRNKYVADCDFVPVPVNAMLAPEYIKMRSNLINKYTALKTVNAGDLEWSAGCGEQQPASEHNSTTHVSIIDDNGNAVSMTSSIEYSFGSGIMVEGFFLNNELTDFSLLPEVDGEKVANRIEPGKRPRSSMAPLMVFDKEGKLYMVLGSPGGSRIISYVLQTLVSVIDWGMQLHEAINQPHFATTGKDIELEKGTSLEAISALLEKIGHNVIVGDLTSGLHGIEIKNNKLLSGVDSRREGEAVGR